MIRGNMSYPFCLPRKDVTCSYSSISAFMMFLNLVWPRIESVSVFCWCLALKILLNEKKISKDVEGLIRLKYLFSVCHWKHLRQKYFLFNPGMWISEYFQILQDLSTLSIPQVVRTAKTEAGQWWCIVCSSSPLRSVCFQAFMWRD